MSWRDALKGLDIAGYRKGGHGQRVGFGVKPAVLVVDMIRLYADPAFALAYSEDLQSTIQAIEKLLRAARGHRLPILYTSCGGRNSAPEKGRWAEKVGGGVSIPPEADRVIDRLAPVDGDVVLAKPKASAFFGTQLASLLTYLNIDTLIVSGMTTSGCVRASVVDAFSYNYRVIVPAECTADRAHLPHYVSLFDIDMKYGDVLSVEETLADLRRCIAGVRGELSMHGSGGSQS